MLEWVLYTWLCTSSACGEAHKGIPVNGDFSAEHCRAGRAEVLKSAGKPQKDGSWVEAMCVPLRVE